MSFIGNLLWIVIGGGFVIFAEYLIAAAILVITVIGIPFAVQCLKLAILGLMPFGKEASGNAGAVSTLGNLAWLPVGLCIALTHLVFAAIYAVTIIGLPFAKQHIKLCGLALTPFGRSIA